MNNVMNVISILDKKVVNMDILDKIVLVVKSIREITYDWNLCLDVRACEDQPCLNNGTCVVYLRSHLCRCQKGFTGRSCEIGKDSKD
jgi:hypothetical protein